MGALRPLLIALAAALTLTACAAPPNRETTAPPERAKRTTPSVELLAWTLIPQQHETLGVVGGLSGAAFLHADDEAGPPPLRLVTDAPQSPKSYDASLALRRTRTGYGLAIELVSQRELASGATDAEALATRSSPTRFGRDADTVTAFESPPTVVLTETRPAHRWQRRTGTLPLPEGFADRVRPNRGFEAAAFVGNELWVATESAIEGDGDEATPEAGALCTVLTTPRPGVTAGLPLAETYHYRTDPMPPHIGGGFAIHSLVEFCALPGGRLLALERSLTIPAGFGAKLFLLDTTTRSEPDARLPMLNKALVADIGALARDAGLAWIGNLEAVALGPSIARLTGDPDEAGRLLLIVADDNFGADIQKTGSMALALRITGAD